MDEATESDCEKCSPERRCSLHDGAGPVLPDDITARLRARVGIGCTSIIELVPPGKHVKKSPWPWNCSHDKAEQVEQIMREVQIYKSLQGHERFPKMIEYSDNGFDSYIVLEYMPNGNLSSYLESTAKITYRQQLQWSLQAAEGIAFLHSIGVIHSDIKPENMLLDKDMCVRVIDLSGSSFHDLPPMCGGSCRFNLPRNMDLPMFSNVTSDIFALGSSIYQIMQRVQPYADLEDQDVAQKYAQKIFPTVADVPCGDIILKCWTCQYASADLVVSALKSRLLKETPSVWSIFYKSLSFSNVLPLFRTWYQKTTRAFFTFVGQRISSFGVQT